MSNNKTPKEEPQLGVPSYLESNRKNPAPKELAEKPKVKPVEGTVAVKKPPLASKVKSAIIAEDLGEVREYLFWDILVPTLKDTVVSLIKNGVEALFYGSASTKQSGKPASSASYSGYYYSGRYQQGNKAAGPFEDWRRSKRGAGYDLSQIVYKGRDGRGGMDAKRQAEEVLDQLVELTMAYGFARVADFYELSRYPSDYTDNSLGWYELSEARVVRVPGGYILDLPKPEPLG